MIRFWFYPLPAVALAGLVIWLRTQFRYRITARHLEIVWWGICVRRVALDNIEFVSKRHTPWAEHWWNTWRPARRRLLIRRRRGWCRNLVITPRRRYEFKAELERAVQKAALNADPEQYVARLQD